MASTWKRSRTMREKVIVAVVIAVAVFVIFAPPLEAFHCPILECSCFHNGMETVKIACPPEHSGMQYTIAHHIIAEELTFDCLNKPITYRPAMLKKFNFTQKIINVLFHRCPLPTDITFHAVLLGLNPRSLRFSANSPQGALPLRVLSHLTKLEILELDNNGLTAIESPVETLEVFNKDDRGIEQVLLPALGSLSLSNNHLTRVPGNLLSRTPNLHNLILSYNMIPLLDERDFAGVEDLQILKLDNNLIETISNAAVFHSLVDLKFLTLDHNRLSTFPTGGLLRNLSNLQVMDLSDNILEKLPNDLFIDTIRLKTLRIARNKHLTELPLHLLQSTEELEELDLSGNNLTAIPPTFLAQTSRLSHLSLRRNILPTLPDDLFINTTSLKSLDISENRLTSLSPELLLPLMEFRELNISGNALKTIGAQVLLGMTQLHWVDFSRNLLEYVDVNAFRNCSQLRRLDLSHNYLSFTPEALPFILPPSLRSLNMSHNTLTSFSPLWLQGNGLRDLNVSYNQMRRVDINIEPNLRHPLRIDLRHNLIATVEVTEPQTIASKHVSKDSSLSALEVESITAPNATVEEVDPIIADAVPTLMSKPAFVVSIWVEDNPLVCDCSLISFIGHLQRGENETVLGIEGDRGLVCTSPPVLRDRHLLSLTMPDLFCPVQEQCADKCRCIQRAGERTVHMDCRKRELHTFPLKAPPNISILDLAENGLTSLRALSEPMWAHLTELRLTRNEVSAVDDAIPLPRRLRTLHLDYNQLEFLPEAFVRDLEAMNITALALAHNPWRCDCRTLHLQQWLQKNRHRVVDLEHVRCQHRKSGRHGEETVNMLLTHAPIVNCFQSRSSNKSDVIIAAVLTLFLAGCLFLGAKLLMRNYYKMKLYLSHIINCKTKPKRQEEGEYYKNPDESIA